MSDEYRPLIVHKPDTNEEDGLDNDEQYQQYQQHHQQQDQLEEAQSFSKWSSTFIILLFLTNAITLLGSLYWASWRELSMKTEPPMEYAEAPHALNTIWSRFSRNATDAEYSTINGKNHWETIHPSHGFIAMDHTWADERGWPETMNLPSDPRKGVYILEAYHYLHCLRTLRMTLREAVEQKAYYTYSPAQTDYCFDTLGQYIQCNAGTTPLYTFGDHTAGEGQLHRCKDWSQLRDFVKRHSACAREDGNVQISEQTGFCDEGTEVVDLNG